MRTQQFFKNLSWLLILNLLIKPVWIFAIDRQVQNIVGHEVYGTYFALLNLCYVLFFIADAGLSNMLTQKLSANERLNIRQLLGLKLLLLILYAGVCLLVAAITGIREWHILHYLIIIQSLLSLFVFLRSVLTARQHFKADAFFSVFDRALLILLCIGPIYGLLHSMTITLFLQLQTISITIAVVGLLTFLGFRGELTAGPGTQLKALARWTAPFVLIVLFMSAHNRLDAFLLERLHADGAHQAGIYAMAYRLLDAGNVFGHLTASFLVPFLSRHQYDILLLQRVVLISRHSLLLIAAMVIAFVFVFAPWIQQVLYHTTDAYSSTVLRLCLAALPAYYLIHIYGSALTATANFGLFIGVILLAAACNVALNFWLIPRYGALGCCIAALFTQYGCGLLLWVTASRKLQIQPSTGTALLYPATAALFSLLFYLGQKLTGNVWIILTSIALIVIIGLASQQNAIRKVFLSIYK